MVVGDLFILRSLTNNHWLKSNGKRNPLQTAECWLGTGHSLMSPWQLSRSHTRAQLPPSSPSSPPSPLSPPSFWGGAQGLEQSGQHFTIALHPYPVLCFFACKMRLQAAAVAQRKGARTRETDRHSVTPFAHSLRKAFPWNSLSVGEGERWFNTSSNLCHQM